MDRKVESSSLLSCLRLQSLSLMDFICVLKKDGHNMRTVYMITQRAFYSSNGYEYQMPTDFGRDVKMFTLEREAEDAFYNTERKYLKDGYTVISSDQNLHGNGQRLQCRLENFGCNAIVLELWSKDVL